MSNNLFKMGKAISAGFVCVLFASSAFAAKPKSGASDQAKAAIVEEFPHAHNVLWKEGQDPDEYTAYFTQHHERTMANVDRNGEILSVLKYYGSRELPPYVQALLERHFAGKSITGVTEFDQYEGDGELDASDITYQVTLEDTSHIYQVLVHNGGLEHVDAVEKT